MQVSPPLKNSTSYSNLETANPLVQNFQQPSDAHRTSSAWPFLAPDNRGQVNPQDFRSSPASVSTESLDGPQEEPSAAMMQGLEKWRDEPGITSEQHRARTEAVNTIVDCVRSGDTLIDLSAMDLTSIPPELFDIPDLDDMDISANALNTLPADFSARAPHLEKLDLSDNQLHALPSGIANLSLQTLNIAKNRITALPGSMATSMEHLRCFDASGNGLTDIPSGFAVPSIETLNLGNNCLTDLPASLLCSILECSKKQGGQIEIDMTDNNIPVGVEMGYRNAFEDTPVHMVTGKRRSPMMLALEEWQDETGITADERSARMEAVRTIADCVRCGETSVDLSALDLTSVPPELFDIPNLKGLDLSGNMLDRLPGDFSARAPHLENLDLSDNRLKALPSHIAHLPLRTLNIARNRITTLPQSMATSMAHLRRFDASGNGLREIPSGFAVPSIETLNLSNNRLAQLPASLMSSIFESSKKQGDQIEIDLTDNEMPVSVALGYRSGFAQTPVHVMTGERFPEKTEDGLWVRLREVAPSSVSTLKDVLPDAHAEVMLALYKLKHGLEFGKLLNYDVERTALKLRSVSKGLVPGSGATVLVGESDGSHFFGVVLYRHPDGTQSCLLADSAGSKDEELHSALVRAYMGNFFVMPAVQVTGADCIVHAQTFLASLGRNPAAMARLGAAMHRHVAAFPDSTWPRHLTEQQLSEVPDYFKGTQRPSALNDALLDAPLASGKRAGMSLGAFRQLPQHLDAQGRNAYAARKSAVMSDATRYAKNPGNSGLSPDRIAYLLKRFPQLPEVARQVEHGLLSHLVDVNAA